eukprot:scaffold12492_cov36-Cyclotella_meneghiniana.AAC.3
MKIPVRAHNARRCKKNPEDSKDFKFFCDTFTVEVKCVSFVDGACEGLFCGGGSFYKSDETLNPSNCTCSQRQMNCILFAVLTMELTDDKGKVYIVNNVVNKTIQHNFEFKETSGKVEAKKLIGSPLILIKAKTSVETILNLALDSKWVVSG